MRRWAVVATAVLLAGCGRADRGPVDPALAAYLPEGAIVVAGVRAERIRATEVGRRLAAAGWLEPQGMEARDLLASWDGTHWLVAARKANGEIALAGPDAAVQAARARHSPPRALLRRAGAVPPDSHLWAVSYGAPLLPSGNRRFAGIQRLLNAMEDITAWADLGRGIRAAVSGNCRDERNAQIVEETLRAFLALGRTVAARRDPALARPYDAIQVEREGRGVRMQASIPPDAAGMLLDSLIPR